MLSKKHRLEAKNFRSTYQKGKKIRGKYGMLVVQKTDNTVSKFGFVVSKKIGKAPTRNRMTRLLRAISYSAIKDFNLEEKGYNFEYVAFEFCNDFNTLKGEYYQQIKKSLQS
jgi:ribonuclease P protein component